MYLVDYDFFNLNANRQIFFFFFLMIRRPPNPPLFPSPTLFRSLGISLCRIPGALRPIDIPQRTLPAPMQAAAEVNQPSGTMDQRRQDVRRQRVDCQDASVRSEEHTSELQSPCNLVCRLLLEKKK